MPATKEEGFRIPPAVRKAAAEALRLKQKGYAGGTETGFRRARQLAKATFLPYADAKVMRAWFARHGPGASHGGTSYPGYLRYLKATAQEREAHKTKFRGAVAWLLWGGDPAYEWIHSPAVLGELKRKGFIK